MMQRRAKHNGRTLLVIACLVLCAAGYWLLPIRGSVVILPESPQSVGVWPSMSVAPLVARAGEQTTITIHDNQPWSFVKLLVDGIEVQRDERYPTGSNPWQWRWSFPAPDISGYQVVFYTECQRGCSERARYTIGNPPTDLQATVPTKLGVVFADPARNWHTKAGWTVELTYVQHQDDANFSIDGLAQRVTLAQKKGLRTLVRIAYARGQSLPPTNDEVALAAYLDYCARLAADDRLAGVYAYIIGSGYNTLDENRLSAQQPTTPEWYARVLNGYSLEATRQDAVIQTMRARDPQLRILVGPVAPWNEEQNGTRRDPRDVPWLNYMNTLVEAIDTASRLREQQGIPFARPDGFALRASGRVDAPEVADNPAQEPTIDLPSQSWNGAQSGFRVYRDWLTIINRYETTRGMPAYITATNTWADANAPLPAQTYPRSWLISASGEINDQPQIQALCWFVDQPLGDMWREFSLTHPMGKMHDANNDFDVLLSQ